MPDDDWDDWDARDFVLIGACERCDREHVDIEHQRDEDLWVCALCLDLEETQQ